MTGDLSLCSKNMDVDEVTIDASANWTPVEKPLDSKDEEGMFTNWALLVNPGRGL